MVIVVISEKAKLKVGIIQHANWHIQFLFADPSSKFINTSLLALAQLLLVINASRISPSTFNCVELAFFARLIGQNFIADVIGAKQ